MIVRVAVFIVVMLSVCSALMPVVAQPLVSPYEFSFPDGISVASPLAVPLGEEAGSKGRVTIKDGHLAFNDGTRLRLWGTTLQWSGIFPDSAMAMKIATRLRELGFNAVRLNTFDISFWGGGSIFEDGTTTSGLSPVQMKKFDWFIYQLKKNGIYVVLPMISVYSPRTGDGVRQVDSIGWASRVSVFFDPAVQRLVRNNVRMLLTHTNAYTGTTYAKEPAIAYMIVTDENSLMNNWMYSQDVVRPNQYGTPTVGSQHLRLIDSLFNAYLRSIGYTSTAALQTAWSTTVADTSNSVRNGGFEDPFSGAWALAVATNNGAQALLQNSDADKVEGSTAARIRIGKLPSPTNAYMIQLYQNLPMVKRLHRYTLSMYAKTTPQRGQRSMAVYLYNNGYPYNSYGLAKDIQLTSAWQKFEFTFTATSSDSTSGAIALQMGADSGDVYLDDVRVREVPFQGLAANERLENNTVRRDPIWTDQVSPARAKDQAAFMSKAMKDLFRSMKRLVRDTLKSDVLIAPSAVTVSYMEQDAADELDIQCHTEYQNAARSILLNPNGGTLPAHSQGKVAGKPFIVQWAAVQFPRTYQNEVATYLPAYAGLQDWDGVFMSSFSDRPTSGAPGIDSAMRWEIMNKPGLLSLMPGASQAFRNGAVVPSEKVVQISQMREALTYPRIHAPQLYSLSIFTDGRLPAFRRVETLLPLAATESVLPHRDVSALAADMIDIRALDAENEQIFWNAQDGILKVVTPTYVSVSGILNGQVVQLPSMLIEQSTTTPHTVVSVASATTAPITEAATSLITIATRCVNADATWKTDNSDLDRWGKGPTQMEGVTVRMTLAATADSVIVRPLNADGSAMSQMIPVTRLSKGRYSFTINTQQYKTPWYRLEQRSASSVEDASVATFTCAPNPAVDHLTIRRDDRAAQADITIVNAMGVVVASMKAGEGGQDNVIDTSAFPPGVYIVRVGAAVQSFIKQ